MMGRAVDAGNVQLQVTGTEHLTGHNGFMLYGNHQGLFDVVALAASCPVPLGCVYKKEIKKYKKAGADIRNSKTPEENRKSILAEKGVDLREATDLYEQIRYGTGNEVDAKDITAMKNFMKAARL